MTARPFLNQWARDVAGELVGRSKKTMKAVGCCVTAAAIAVRELGVDPLATGVTVMQNAMAKWDGVEWSASQVYAEGSAAAMVGRLGQGNGVVVHDIVNRAQPRMWTDLVEALERGLPVMMSVDKNGDDKQPEHWLCAVELQGDVVVYGDPDGGLRGFMNRVTLEGRSPDGEHHYRVLGVRVVTTA